MSEDFPDGVPQPEMVRPEDEQRQGVSIPVVEELGEQAVAPVAEGADQQSENNGRVEDVDKAWDMAHAGNEDRTKAAEWRDLQSMQEDVWGLSEDRGRAKRELHATKNPLKKVAKSREFSENLDTWHKADDELRVRRTEKKEQAVSDGLYNPHREFYDDEEIEAMYEKRAERLEAWAGILHDHPPGEEFHAAFPDFEVTPEALVLMEDDVEQLKAQLERANEQAFDPYRVDDLIHNGPEYARGIRTMKRNVSQELGQKYDDALAKVKEAVYDLNEAYNDMLASGELLKLENDLKLKSHFLEMIHRGAVSLDAIHELGSQSSEEATV